ncbi:MAG: TetR/AcrR family transcriptional regulator, partial [Anaerolineae bacterium]|nr:TetR/AcrR family transcriptional regulator [Anaerolineae bacterium]
MVRPKQSEQHPDLQAAIKETARTQIAENGAATLSLRAIARELKITAPAIYNYFPSRDDLVTALIVDAYNSLRDAILTSQATAEVSQTERILESARAYRGWARAHPEEYSLIFGTPIPNYHAPMEITGPAAAGSMAAIISVFDTAWRAGALNIEGILTETPEMIQTWIDKFEYSGPPEIIQITMASWAQIHGIVSLELNGHYTAFSEEVTI